MDRWDYRVIEFIEDDMRLYAIHEVFYEKNRPISYAINPATVDWDEFDSELGRCHEPRSMQAVGREILERFSAAIEKPILKASDFPNEKH